MNGTFDGTMSATTSDILFLFFATCALLLALTLFGEVLRSRYAPAGDSPVIETYLTRVHSWWAMVVLLSLALLSGKIGALILFGFAAFAALREFLTLSYKKQADHLPLALAFYVVLPLQFLFVGLDWQGLYAVFIPVYAFLMLPIVTAFRGDPERFIDRVSQTQWGLMIAVYCGSHVPALLQLDIPGYPNDRGVLLIAFLVMVVQTGDLLDFFFGRRIGRRKVLPRVSPKTWEGMLCGVGSAALMGVVLAWLTPFSPLAAAAMAALASLVGQFGNLVFATIKHSWGVKDFSHLIPGQGGFLSQLDSVLFAAPIFYHLTHLIWAA